MAGSVAAGARALFAFAAAWGAASGVARAGGAAADPFATGRFLWRASRPVLTPRDRGGDPGIAVKDPSVVRYGGKWHVFHSVRRPGRTHSIEYVASETWEGLDGAERHLLACRDGYFCAPQVFYFRPHRRWYLVYQVVEKGRKPGLQPAYSTTETLEDASSWSPARLLFEKASPRVRMWIDFWIICDGERAYLFFTSLDGRLWRTSTPLEDFPRGFGDPALALRADIFEAAHVYSLRGSGRYLAIIEAQGGPGWRYYKAYTADSLAGAWMPLADTQERPFAGARNVRQPEGRWTDAVSHGELLRGGVDETLPVDPRELRLLFQGVTNAERRGKPYGRIPWKLGLLEPARTKAGIRSRGIPRVRARIREVRR